jgi:glyoxylase-like metal-dependent hydrolase (beta-lactamase superfamily II)
VRAIDVRHTGRERVICCWEHDGVLVDPGPESCLETLLEALDERPRAVLLTHIHFDHAGATGALVRRWPGLPVYVHRRGARHLADPERLVASAARLYGGEEGLRRLWGEVVPVPEEVMHPLEGGESVLEEYRVEYTPGHASHHVAYLHEATGTAFVGDVAGVRIPPADFTVAPTPPPDIDIDAWERSLDTIARWSPQTLALTHFGPVEDAEAQLEVTRARLREEAELAAEHDAEGFTEAIRARIESETDAETAAAFLQAAPPDHLWLGLDRWRRQQSDASL